MTRFFKQHLGIYRVNNFYEMFDTSQVFATQSLPKGKNIAITTSSGSLGILACDQIEQLGLNLAVLSKSTIHEMKSITPHLKELRNLSSKLKKPIIICVFGSRWVVEYFLKYATKYKIPIMTQISHAIKAFKFMYNFSKSNKNMINNTEI